MTVGEIVMSTGSEPNPSKQHPAASRLTRPPDAIVS